MATGEVKWFSDQKGFGFITTDDNADVFVHFSGIIAPEGDHRTLTDGQRVEFDVQETEKGPKAIGVKKL